MSARDTVIRCIWGIPGEGYVIALLSPPDLFWDRERAHRFTADEAKAWIAGQWREALKPEDYVTEIDAPPDGAQGDLFVRGT